MTCLAYLAEPTRGGRTVFPKLGVGFDPRVGGEFLLLFPYGRLVMTYRVLVTDAVLWWNVNESGVEDPATLHAGEPVEVGEKFALNLWLRQRPRREVSKGKDECVGVASADKDVDTLADKIANGGVFSL